MQAADGSYLTDVDMTVKAMRHTGAHNLDAQETLHSPSLQTGMSQQVNSISLVTMSNGDCAVNLDNLGLQMKRSSTGTNLAVKAFKRIEIDRIRLYQSKNSEASKESIWRSTPLIQVIMKQLMLTVTYSLT